MRRIRSIKYKLYELLLVVMLYSCTRYKEFNIQPEVESLQKGIETTAALGYCASVVMAVVEGKQLPANVAYDENTGLIYVSIDKYYPLPFNKNIGDIVIAFHWSGRAGLMSVLFANIDLLGGTARLYGLHLVPIMKQDDAEGISAVLVKQDIIIGNGSDTLLDMSNITDLIFNTKIDQLNSEKPDNIFVAVKQNVWFINIDQNNTYSNLYDDIISVNGGGQIVQANAASGGVIYHAMIDTKMNYSDCDMNPVSGFALIQNFKAGGTPLLDLGSSLISFHNNCDGRAHVDLGTGKYVLYNGKYISLGLN